MNTIRGLTPMFGEGLYEVTTTEGQGYLYYDGKEWCNVELNDQYQPLDGDVTFIHRKVLDSSILETEEVTLQ